MKTRRQLVTHPDLNALKEKLFHEIRSLSTSIEKTNAILPLQKSIITLDEIDLFRGAIQHLNDSNVTFKNAIIKELYEVYTSAPSCVKLFLEVLSRKNHLDENEIAELEETLRLKTRKQSLKNIINNISFFIKNDHYKKALLLAIERGGSSSAYEVNATNLLHTTVKIEEGFEISGSIDPFFLAKIGKNEVELKNVKIIPIDGQIIEVSQLHHLLTEANQTNTPLLLAARGYDRNVTNTLAFNFLKKNLEVIPFVLSGDLECINDIHDISTLCACIPVSQQKGDLLSTIKLEDFEKTFAIKASNKKLVFKGDSECINAGMELIKRLNDQIKDEAIYDKKEILIKRKAKLHARKTIISLQISGEKIGLHRDRINSFILFLRNIALQGSIPTKTLEEKLSFDNLTKISFLPSRSALESIKKANTLNKQISNIGAILQII